MALRIWLPLNGDLENKGISNGTVTTTVTNIWNDNGKIGKCILSNAKASYTFPELTNITNFSISYWIYIDSSITIQNWADIWGINCTAGNSNTVIRDEFKSAVGIHQLLMGKDSAVGSNTNTYIGTGMSDSNAKDKWVHIALVKDNTTAKVYTNGILTNTINSSTFESTPQKLTGYLIIGNTTSSAAKLNDFRIYDHCLSAKEIKEISQGLVLHYKLDGFSGGAGENLLKGNYHVSTAGSTNSSTGSLALDTDLMPLSSLPGKTLTFTYDYSIEGNKLYNNTGDYTKDRYGIHLSYNYTNGSNTSTSYPGAGYLTISGTGRAVQTFTIPSGITVNSFNVGIQPYNKPASGNNNIWYLKNVKLEEGNIDTGWSLNHNDSGIALTKISDSSGYGNDGIITGNLITNNNSKRYLNSTTFNGSSNISLTNFYIGNEWSYGCWIYSPTSSRGWEGIIILNNNGGDSDTQLGFYTNPGGNRIQNTANGQYNSGIAMTYGQWNHFFGTFDGSNLKTYINGVLVNTKTITNALLSKINLTIGARSSNVNGAAVSAAYPFLGQLSDIRIYTTALSAEDILDLYHTPASIDNLGGIHGFEINEINIPYSINQIGQINMGNFFENGYEKYLKYDNNIYIEPDGSQWIHVFHHNDPTTSGYFVRNSDWEHGVYIDENKWYNIEEIVYTLPKYEFMIKQKTTSSAAEAKYRWIQDINPLEATYNDVRPGTAIFNTSSGYTNSSYGGLWKMNSSARMCIANASSGNWYGALGSWSTYNTNQVPGFPNTNISTGYIDLYMRIYPPAKIVKDLGMSGNTFIEK